MKLTIRNIDLPKGNVRYPEALEKRREDILARFEEVKDTVQIRPRLSVIADAFRLFAAQHEYEAALRVKALAVMMRDKTNG